MVEEKVWCPACEEERWVTDAGAGWKCVWCQTYIPAEDVIPAEQEVDDGRA